MSNDEKYPTIERLADLTNTTVGYQKPDLEREAVLCWRELAVLRERLAEAEREMTPAFKDCRENFVGKGGQQYLVRCPSCKRENYAPAVSSGQCAWCGWKEEKPK